jgi:photosystem II stability/assembly factor-like uncharacterized protein
MKNKITILLICSLLFSLKTKSQMWIQQNINQPAAIFDFYGLTVLNKDTVLGFANNNYIYRTLDGGANWYTLSGIPPATRATCYQALSADTAWIATFDNADSAKIFKTTDGGLNWLFNKVVGLNCDFFHFFNSNEGVTFSDPINGSWVVYTTNDGGNTWLPASIPQPLPTENCMDRHHYIVGDNVWITSTQGRIFYSTNKGTSWNVSVIDTVNFPISFRVAFYSAQEGIAIKYNAVLGDTSLIYRTHDGGVAWNKISSTGYICQSFNGAAFIVPNSNVLFSNGENGAFGSSFSSDSGVTWNLIDTSQGYGAIDGKDWNSLWSGQRTTMTGVGGVAKWDGTLLKIKENLTDNGFAIFPNPVTNEIATISYKLNRQAIIDISLFDISGKLIFQQSKKGLMGSNTFPISFENIESGIYILNWNDGDNKISKRVIIF